MSNKKVTIESRKEKYFFIIIEENNGYECWTAKEDFIIWSPGTKKVKRIGHSNSLSDAISLIKSTINGTIDNTSIEDWK